jgi:hypothetical protein
MIQFEENGLTENLQKLVMIIKILVILMNILEILVIEFIG